MVRIRDILDEEDYGAARSTDPDTSHAAARKAKVSKTKLSILLELNSRSERDLRTGLEISAALGKRSDWVVPRLAPLYRAHLIECRGKKLNTESNNMIRAYAITEFGRTVLRVRGLIK